MLTIEDKIGKINEWVAPVQHVAEITGVEPNDISRVLLKPSRMDFENALKVSMYVDVVEQTITEAIVILDWLVGQLDSKRERLTGNQNLHQKIMRKPFEVFETLHRIVYDPMYSFKLQGYLPHLSMVESRIATLDVTIVDKLTLSESWLRYAHEMRHKLNLRPV